MPPRPTPPRACAARLWAQRLSLTDTCRLPATFLRMAAGTTEPSPTIPTTSSSIPSASVFPPGSSPNLRTVNSTTRSKCLTTDAITCDPRCDRSRSTPTAQAPRGPAAESAPLPQSPAAAKTTREPKSIWSLAIRSHTGWSTNVCEEPGPHDEIEVACDEPVRVRCSRSPVPRRPARRSRSRARSPALPAGAPRGTPRTRRCRHAVERRRRHGSRRLRPIPIPSGSAGTPFRRSRQSR